MGTRARIGITNAGSDGVVTVTSIYTHWYGYPAWTGPILLGSYASEAKVRALMALGNLSTLGPEIGEAGQGHSYEAARSYEKTDPRQGWCVSYSRDREDKDGLSVDHAAEEWPDSSQEYEYLFSSGACDLEHADCVAQPLLGLACAAARGAEGAWRWREARGGAWTRLAPETWEEKKTTTTISSSSPAARSVERVKTTRTRRDRLEAKVEKRGEWAAKASARSAQRFASANRIADGIPLGQPILVGHHSERRARKDQARIHTNMDKGVEQAKLADHHASKARGLEIQLDRTIFDDDPDAIEMLEARIARREANAKRANAINATWRKGYKKGGADGAIAELLAIGVSAVLAKSLAETALQFSWLTRKGPCDATGDRALIRTDKQRIEHIKTRRSREEQAEAAPGGVLVTGETWVRVTFPERPEREILTALRAAGFRWGGGFWQGERSKLPTEVRDLMGAEAVAS